MDDADQTAALNGREGDSTRGNERANVILSAAKDHLERIERRKMILHRAQTL